MHGQKLGLAVMLAAGLLTGAVAQAPPARVTYTMSFQGSQPAFVNIVMSRDGPSEFQAKLLDADPAFALTFTASPKALATVFGAAAALNDFIGPTLESKHKVAFTGEKMLAFDDASHHGSQTFTYTTVPAAARLVELMEKISVAGADALRIQNTQRYQPLNMLTLMEQVQNDWHDQGMAEPQLLAPTLRALVANPAALQAARDRAQMILDGMAKAKR